MKKFYVGLPLVIGWTIVLTADIATYIWWTSDVGEFVLVAFIMLLLIPLTIEAGLVFFGCRYVTIDEYSIKRHNMFGKVKTEYAWSDVQDVRVNACWLYVSLEKLVGETKNWNQKKYISFMYSEKAVLSLQQHLPTDIFSGIEDISH
ncbi:MAG: hypothetical protein IJE50_05650 [Clostridia bacterium]|nr:hypothetical protein [Clostridia bacterium]